MGNRLIHEVGLVPEILTKLIAAGADVNAVAKVLAIIYF
jgi:hypothetical protein